MILNRDVGAPRPAADLSGWLDALVRQAEQGGHVDVTNPLPVIHPECGIERFLVERRDDGVWVRIDAISRPGWLLTRVGAPVARVAQRWMTRRYLRALAR